MALHGQGTACLPILALGSFPLPLCARAYSSHPSAAKVNPVNCMAGSCSITGCPPSHRDFCWLASHSKPPRLFPVAGPTCLFYAYCNLGSFSVVLCFVVFPVSFTGLWAPWGKGSCLSCSCKKPWVSKVIPQCRTHTLVKSLDWALTNQHRGLYKGIQGVKQKQQSTAGVVCKELLQPQTLRGFSRAREDPHVCMRWSLFAVTTEEDTDSSMDMLIFSLPTMCQDSQKLISNKDYILFPCFAFQNLCPNPPPLFFITFALWITWIEHSKSLWSDAIPFSLQWS